jgi:hypothetical protein
VDVSFARVVNENPKEKGARNELTFSRLSSIALTVNAVPFMVVSSFCVPPAYEEERGAIVLAFSTVPKK